MTRHPYDYKNRCCLFDADAPIHDVNPTREEMALLEAKAAGVIHGQTIGRREAAEHIEEQEKRFADLEAQLAAVEKERDEATGALAAARGVIELLVQAVDTERSLRGWSTGAQVDALTSPALIHAAAFLFSSAADLAARHDAEIRADGIVRRAELIGILQEIREWRDSDGNEGFPHEVRQRMDAALDDSCTGKAWLAAHDAEVERRALEKAAHQSLRDDHAARSRAVGPRPRHPYPGEAVTDPKPITVAEVERIGPEWAYYESVKAAARAAAEADSLRARLAKLEAWQVAVADGLGFLNRAEGQDGYEVAAPEAIIAACRKAEKVSRSYHSSLARKAAEAALTVAQGEVVVLREALLTACSWAQCPIEEEGVKGEWVEDVKKIRAALTSTRASADAYRESEWRRAIVWWVNHGTINTTTDEALRALAHPTKEPKP